MNATSKARQLRKDSTQAEITLWKYLRGRRFAGHKFRRQTPIGLYIVDFVCFEKNLVIELDGGQHQEQVEYDNQRTEWLESQGFRVLRYWNNEVLSQTESVNEAIWQALEHPHSFGSAQDRLNPLPFRVQGRTDLSDDIVK